MKKSKKIGLIIVIVLAIYFGVFYIWSNIINLKTSKLNLVHEFTAGLIDSSEYEPIAKEIPDTYCVTFCHNHDYCIDKQNHTNFGVDNIREYFLKSHGIPLPESLEFDFDKYGMVIAIGRKIDEIKYYDFNLELGGIQRTFHRARITFGSEYSEGKLYIYQMDHVMLKDESLGRNYYYIMDGNKKEFAGRSMLDVNRYTNSKLD